MMKEGYYYCTAYPYDIFKVVEDRIEVLSSRAHDHETIVIWLSVKMRTAYIGAQWIPIETPEVLNVLNTLFPVKEE